MKEEENILRIFEGTKEAIKNNDIPELKKLSDQTVHTASISQDPDNIAVAVIVYSLSKIIERGYIKDDRKKEIIAMIEELISIIKRGNDEKIKVSLVRLRSSLEKFSGKMKSYIQDVFRKASINKASKIYEHGISMEKTASLLGITMFELADYAGQKETISETPENKTIDVKSRIKLAEEIFGR
jgi:hypothetical protein